MTPPRLLIPFVAVALFPLAGCMPRMTVEQLKAEMEKRPAELDRLDMLVGRWEGAGEVRMPVLDQPLKLTMTAEAKWAGHKRYLVEEIEWRMGDIEPGYSTRLWVYDPKGREYRTVWVESVGVASMAECEYEEKERHWEFSADSHGPAGKTRQFGRIRFVDDNTIEWTFTEYWGLIKIVEMTGTARRK